MKKKNSKEMDEVLDLVDRLKPVFFLQGWSIDVDVGVHKEPHHSNPDVCAELTSSNRYRSASLNVYPRFFKESKEERHHIIVHEFCHIISAIQNGLLQTARRSVQVSDSESQYAFEEETSWFANIISKLMK